MSSSTGDRDDSQLRPGDSGGRYWSAPGCRVRVDDGTNVTWIDLKRPYALIGSHPCCTLRIRGAHVPEVAYFLCCLRDRVEIWPTAAIAFPRWGAIGTDLQVVLGPCSLTFHPESSLPTRKGPNSYLADSEIETRLSWPGQTFSKMLRRPVTIIGDDHPSVLRLHGRGLSGCNYAAVVQDQSAWIVDLSARRMQRSERVHRFQIPGETFQLGDAVLEFISGKPLISDDDTDDSGIGLGIGEDVDLHAQSAIHSYSDIHSHSDIHSEDATHSEDGQAGMSALASGIHTLDPDPSASLVFSRPSRKPSDPPPADDSPAADPPTENRQRRQPGSSNIDGAENDSDDSDHDAEDPALCLSNGKGKRLESFGDDEFDSQVDARSHDAKPNAPPDTMIHRVDHAKSGAPRPTASDAGTVSSRNKDASTTDAALSLVDTALGLVDAAVHESDSTEIQDPPQDDSIQPSPVEQSNARDATAKESVIEQSIVDETVIDVAKIDGDDLPNLNSDVFLTSHDPPLLVDHGETTQRNDTVSQFPLPQQAVESRAVQPTESSAAPKSESSPQDFEPNDDLTGANDSIFAELTDLEEFAQASQIESLVLPQSLEPLDQEVATPPPLGLIIVDSDAQPDHTSAPDIGEPENPSGAAENEPPSPTNLAESDETLGKCPGGETEEAFPVVADRLASEHLITTSSSEETDTDQTSPEQPEVHEMTTVEPAAEPLAFVVQPASVSLPIESESKERFSPRTEKEAARSPQPNDVPQQRSMEPSLVATSPSKQRTVDPEALTSHITTRLTEMRQSRTILQQVLRWTAITVGIIVPSTVVAWVIHRIYSDWQ